METLVTTEQATMAATSAAPSAHRPTLTIVIPCFNERETVLEVIERVKRAPVDKFVVVIDNASTDGTRELLRSVCTNERPCDIRGIDSAGPRPGQRMLDGDGFTVVLQPSNQKKGTSVKTGLALARSDYVICQDADLEYDPLDIVRLLDHAELTGAAAVFGSRLLKRPGFKLDLFHLGRLALAILFRSLYGSHLTDVATCYKLMRTDVARSLDMESSGFDLDFEIPAKLARMRYTVAELPISYSPRSVARGKKLRWRHGFSAAWTLVKLRVLASRRGRSWASPGGVPAASLVERNTGVSGEK
jgi:dolichol-phosphate mannosyltransferase